MTQTIKYTKYLNFREEYSYFSFNDFSVARVDDELRMKFFFSLDDKYSFEPEMSIQIGEDFLNGNVLIESLKPFVFHIGMVELISYWKAACPKKVIIKPYTLNDEQIAWWKYLYFQGLGEFFYVNGIPAKLDDFMEIECQSSRTFKKSNLDLIDQVLVPVGGGKDSVVSLELLKTQYNALPLIMNPRKATLDTVVMAGYGKYNYLKIKRSIHPALLELNKQGFLNGHTPFSALLAFVTVLSAILSGRKHIMLSNESSANEATVAGTDVNHQYSKSMDFERNFREYVNKWLHSEVDYKSFLRPLSELQIGKIFSQFEKHHATFRSCNVGSKTDSWCGKCSKCLFTYIILSPFIEPDKLNAIYGNDMYNDEDLVSVFRELLGLEETKPFECVGTVDEVLVCVNNALKWFPNEKPYLLKYFLDLNLVNITDLYVVLDEFDNDHFLDNKQLNILKKAL
jgi:hypothetical protein